MDQALAMDSASRKVLEFESTDLFDFLTSEEMMSTTETTADDMESTQYFPMLSSTEEDESIDITDDSYDESSTTEVVIVEESTEVSTEEPTSDVTTEDPENTMDDGASVTSVYGLISVAVLCITAILA